MTNSMTGFGRAEVSGDGYQFSVEMKSVNHRFSEIVIKMPRNLNMLEENIRKDIQDKVNRGRIEVYINVKETEEKKRLVKVDKGLTLSYDNSLKELAKILDTAYKTDIYRLVSLPEVLSVEDEEVEAKALWPVLQTAVQNALEELLRMRFKEGERLQQDLLKRIEVLRSYKKEIAERSYLVVAEYQEKLNERLKVLLSDTEINEERMAMEVALFADRASIEEEIVRLESHFEQFENAMLSQEPVGRKLDFLLQEMNREVNTIGSKANDLVISRIVVESKSELEKIREQVQNIE